MTSLHTDGLRQCVSHRSMVEGTEQSTFTVHREVTRCPDSGRAYVTRENCVLGCELVEHTGNILRMDWPFVGITSCQVIQAFARLPVVFQRILEVLLVLVLFQLGQQCAQSGLRVPNKTKVELGPASQLFSAKVDLHDGRVFGKELLVWKVRADHQQDFAIHYGDVAGRESEKPGHADVEGIVILNKLLATQSMHDGSLQLAG